MLLKRENDNRCIQWLKNTNTFNYNMHYCYNIIRIGADINWKSTDINNILTNNNNNNNNRTYRCVQFISTPMLLFHESASEPSRHYASVLFVFEHTGACYHWFARCFIPIKASVPHISWTTPVLWLTCEHQGFKFKNTLVLGIIDSTGDLLLLKHQALVCINAPGLQYFRTRPVPIVQCRYRCVNVLSATMHMVCEVHHMEKHPLQSPPNQFLLVIMKFHYNLRKTIRY